MCHACVSVSGDSSDSPSLRCSLCSSVDCCCQWSVRAAVRAALASQRMLRRPLLLLLLLEGSSYNLMPKMGLATGCNRQGRSSTLVNAGQLGGPAYCLSCWTAAYIHFLQLHISRFSLACSSQLGWSSAHTAVEPTDVHSIPGSREVLSWCFQCTRGGSFIFQPLIT